MTPPDWIAELRQHATEGTGPCAGCPAYKDGRAE